MAPVERITRRNRRVTTERRSSRGRSQATRTTAACTPRGGTRAAPEGGGRRPGRGGVALRRLRRRVGRGWGRGPVRVDRWWRSRRPMPRARGPRRSASAPSASANGWPRCVRRTTSANASATGPDSVDASSSTACCGVSPARTLSTRRSMAVGRSRSIWIWRRRASWIGRNLRTIITMAPTPITTRGPAITAMSATAVIARIVRPPVESRPIASGRWSIAPGATGAMERIGPVARRRRRPPTPSTAAGAIEMITIVVVVIVGLRRCGASTTNR